MHVNSYRPRFALLFYSVVILLALCPATLARQTDRAAKIKEVLTQAHQYGQFNGAVLVAENGKIIFRDGFGMANMEWNIPVTPDTRFRLGSITKQFTAALILQLVEQGKVKLDGRITDYLPDYRRDIGDRVTVHQLLTHTSGIPSYTSIPGFFADASRNPFTVEEFIKKYASRDLEYEPGAKYSYNNSGYFLLGAIIERVTGKPYEQALKEMILDPVGMKNTGYDRHDRIIERRAAGYVKTPAGYRNAPYLDMSIPYAAGSMYSTVEDLYLWDQALYTDKVLSAKSRELMFKPALNNYAYGWSVEDAPFKPNGQSIPVIHHGGGIHGFNTSIIRYTGQRNLIVLLDNTSQGASVEKLGATLARVLYDQPFEMPKRSGADALMRTINEKGLAAGVAEYRALKAKPDPTLDTGEDEMNTLGYMLLRSGKVKEAIEIFKLNVESHPKSSNPYDSLGEAYMVAGDKELSIQNYRRALELNPKNTNAADMLRRLESAPVTVDPKIYDSYAGEYEVSPKFAVTITHEDGKLMAQATGQPKFEIYPESETLFFARVVPIRMTFVRDEQGRVTGIRIHQGGRDMPAKKVK